MVAIIYIRIISLQSHNQRLENARMGTLLLLSILGCLSVAPKQLRDPHAVLQAPRLQAPAPPAHQQIQSTRILGWGNIPISTCLVLLFLYAYIALQKLIVFFPRGYKC